MAYRHGVYVSEIPTAIKPPVNTEGCLPVVIGTAPLHLASDAAAPNTPVLCSSYAEAVQAFGFHNDFSKYSISEVIYMLFAAYGYGPLVVINVLDPSVHNVKKTNTMVSLTEHKAVITDPVMLSTLVVKENTGTTTLTENVDYTAAYDTDGNLVITVISEAHADDIQISVSYTALDPGAVKKSDIIGGVDVTTGKNKGLECVNSVFTKLGMVPGMILAPGFSSNPEVAAVMAAKAESINGLFYAVALIDGDTTTVRKYSDVKAWKDKNNVTQRSQWCLWPMAKFGDRLVHLSTVAMGTQVKLTNQHDDIPYESPSNKTAQITGLCLSDGTEVEMSVESANYLNGNGVVTALNWIGGWKLWGDETAVYPANTDPKDRFIPVRCMFNWNRQTFIRTHFNEVDGPLRPAHVESIVDSENIRINGLVAAGVIIAGYTEFRDADNPATSIVAGIAKFHQVFIPPVPNRVIDMDMEFDSELYKQILTGGNA